MAQYTQTLNPPKTLIPKLPNPNPSFSSIASFRTRKPNSKNFSTLSVSAMARQNQRQQPPPLNALLNGARKDEVLGAIGSSLSNCLSETNLHLTVPGLKSKTRGKVNSKVKKKKRFLFCFSFFLCCYDFQCI